MKKTNKYIAVVLSLAMIMAFPLIGNADTNNGTERSFATTGTDIPFDLDGSLDLEPATLGVGATLSADSTTYTETFTCSPQVDCSLNFQINRNSTNDLHRGDSSTYKIYVKKDAKPQKELSEEVSEEVLKDYKLTAKGKYYFTVVRTYPSATKNVYISVTTKLNPEVIGETYSNSYTGDKDASKYYSFTPTHDGGYLFKLTPDNGCIGANRNYLLTVYSKIGSSVNEFASYETGVSKSNLRLYLKSNVEYIVKAQAFGGSGLGYSFSVETVPVGPSLSLVGAPALSLNSETGCVLYPFANRQAFAWFSFTAPKDGCYEFSINNRYDASKTGDIVVELRDEAFSPIQEEDTLYVFENETGTLSKIMKEGESCYLQVAEQYKGVLSDVYSVGITVREHAHINKIVIDGNYVIKGCPCQNEEAMEYAYWIEVGAKNITYTGKTVKAQANLNIQESYCKEGYSIPKIPSSAYTVSVISKNKKDIGAAKAKIKFQGEYKALGTYKVGFKIVPKDTALKSVTAGNKSFTAKWKKQSKHTNGYQLRYSLYEGMYDAKSVTIKNVSTLTKKVSNLKEKTDYYVQVRTFKTIKGKQYCSGWSAKKKVTVE